MQDLFFPWAGIGGEKILFFLLEWRACLGCHASGAVFCLVCSFRFVLFFAARVTYQVSAGRYSDFAQSPTVWVTLAT